MKEASLTSLHQIVEEHWTPLLVVRKGRSLILRALTLLDENSVRDLMLRLLNGLPALIKKETSDPVRITAQTTISRKEYE